MVRLTFILLFLPSLLFAGWGSGGRTGVASISYSNRVNQDRLDAAAAIMPQSNFSKVAHFAQSCQRLSIPILEAWFMRSGFNVGTGTRVQGLNGNYGGTIYNGATWGPDGLTLAVNGNAGVSTTIQGRFDRNETLFFVASLEPSGETARGVVGAAGNSNIVFQIVTSSGISKTIRRLDFWMSGTPNATRNWSNFSPNVNVPSKFFAAMSKNFSSLQGTQTVDSRTGTGSITSNGNTMGYNIGASQNPSLSWSGVISFYAHVNAALTADQIQQVRELYKSTVGADEALP